ncbi:MAG: DeoR/GlpR transcriptional regulator [Hyphomicrobiales bacterium]|nr:DeoR/GlpR transcriptional regulator [Hyphomicrobiales bacterium]
MKGRDRRDAIFEQVRLRGFVVIDDLARRFGVTTQTIRRDLKSLCDAGLLVRHHGGAGLPSSIANADLAERRVSQLPEREAIARAIDAYLPDGSTLFMAIGTTMEIVARGLLQRHGFKVITNNLHVATVLSTQTDFDVVVAGGSVHRHNGGIYGASACDQVDRFRADYAIISVGAIEADGTLLDFYSDEVHVAQAMMRNARQVLVAADHTKFERNATVHLGNLSEATALFTDRPPPPAVADLMARHGVELHVAVDGAADGAGTRAGGPSLPGRAAPTPGGADRRNVQN